MGSGREKKKDYLKHNPEKQINQWAILDGCSNE